MSLRHSYSVLAPIYDLLVAHPLDDARRRSLARLPSGSGESVLVNGIGTGLDIPHLPAGYIYTGSDITPAMLRIADQRAVDSSCEIELLQADSMQLPFEDATFDHIIMHLILAVVPKPELALSEACRVLKSGGRIYILDKFLKPGERAPIRKLMNLFIRHIATRTDVVFEEAMKHSPQLSIQSDVPALAGGWFRLIECRKQ